MDSFKFMPVLLLFDENFSVTSLFRKFCKRGVLFISATLFPDVVLGRASTVIELLVDVCLWLHF